MNKFSVIVGLLIIGLVGLVFMAASNKESVVIAGADEILKVSPNDYVLGTADSKVVLFEYADYECPACAAYHPLVKEVARKYSEQIAVVSRHFPLPFHSNAKQAAWAVEAAGVQGKFHEMADLVFADQANWSGKQANIALFYPYAESLGLDMEQFRVDAVSDGIKEKVDQQLSEGRGIGVNQTPSFYLNDQPIRGMQSLEDFSQIIDAALEQVAERESEETTVINDAVETETSSSTQQASTTQ